jgi:Protein of unknown function (DUF2630)
LNPIAENIMADKSSDQPVLHHIKALSDEEHRLYEKGNLSDEETARLAKLKVELDQCWDLLRQRRALREYGRDPDDADVRPPSTVELYEG